MNQVNCWKNEADRSMFYWGIIIVISAFMIQFICFGIIASIGIYNIEFLEEFGTSAAATSVVGSISMGLLLGAGPVASYLMSRLSCRCVALIGAGISSVGLLCVPFAPNIIYLYVFYGVFTGLGFCLLYVPSHTLCGLYFDKHRCLATGVATSGSGLGGFAFPIIIHFLIERYTWRGSMLLLAGISLNNFIFAWLLRPVELYKSTKPDALLSAENERMLEEDKTTEVKELQVTPNGDTETEIVSNKKHRKHCYVLCSVSFLIYCMNNIGWNASGVIVLVLGPEYYTEFKLNKEQASWAFTLIGLGTFIGSVIGSMIGNIRHINRMTLYIVSNTLLGVVALLMTCPLVQNFIGICCVNFVWGVLFGVILALLIVVVADILGSDALGDGVGYLMLSNGIGCLLGPPLGGTLKTISSISVLVMVSFGWLKDVSGSYFQSFLLNGLLILFSALIMIIIPIRQKLCKKKSRRQSYVTEFLFDPVKVLENVMALMALLTTRLFKYRLADVKLPVYEVYKKIETAYPSFSMFSVHIIYKHLPSVKLQSVWSFLIDSVFKVP
ncbi:hypothetical protein KUTeg_004336 [Tegillarca granosa]|uniref:Major facilitator superfamily (MFS) profile domain-containing protein n=1 Tax=Tegillarca granosa TaxID=220873 RepID=A0ABQ9FU66_TEGGR|nr:hypothetical protein KUTeg_004336 [Tegillarca granosa]